MPAFGLLLLLAGGLILRQVAVGRAKETPEDMRDLFSALVSADTEKMQEVLAQRGVNVDATDDSGGSAAESVASTLTGVEGNTDVGKEVVRLGSSAKGYSIGQTGPSYYDCSGLVWRAFINCGYKCMRFTTATFPMGVKDKVTRVTTPAIGDIVLWPTHHMGVVIGTDKLYSARSKQKGIGPSSISGDSSYFKSEPQYWRVTG